MTAPVACVMCLITPDAQQMAIPLAQATIIVAPIFLRDRIRRAWRVVRPGPREDEPDPEQEPEPGIDPLPARPEVGAG